MTKTKKERNKSIFTNINLGSVPSLDDHKGQQKESKGMSDAENEKTKVYESAGGTAIHDQQRNIVEWKNTYTCNKHLVETLPTTKNSRGELGYDGEELEGMS